MKSQHTYIIYRAAEATGAERLPLLRGRLSYIAEGSRLLAEKLPDGALGDMMIVASENGDEHIAAAIYDEYRRRKYSSVFLDIDGHPSAEAQVMLDNVAEALVRRVGRVFIPEIFSEYCTCATPVATCAVTGGIITEYLERIVGAHRRLAVSIPRISADFSMPSDCARGHELTRAEVLQIKNRYDCDVYYSPQMMTNYFTYSPARGECRFVLFDDARSISEKIKLAKSFGISDIFLSWREISDIADDIIF